MSFIDDIMLILEAAKAGKEIQQRKLGTVEWSELTRWDFSGFDYRVKPEPREWLMQESALYAYQVKPEWLTEKDKFVKVREVIE